MDDELDLQAPDYNWNSYNNSNNNFGNIGSFEPTPNTGSLPDYGPSQNNNQFDYGSDAAPQGWGNTQIQMSPEELFAAGQMPTTTNWNPNTSGGIQQALADIFNKKNTPYIGAALEGIQNIFKANSMNKLASSMQKSMDPFGGQRPFYQQQLQSAVQNPYSAPIVRDQVAQLQAAQAAKDAAAGRRSNGATSAPSLLAAQAQIAQQYINSLMQPAGANISPSGLSSLLSTMNGANTAGINNFITPVMTAMQKQNQEEKLTELLQQLKG